MSDPLSLGLASTAVSLVNGTLNLLKEARDSAKRSDDHDLKDKLSEVYDAVLELKECVGSLKDENVDLLRRLQTRATLKWDTRLKLYFAENDPDPFCPTCMDQNEKQVRLYPDTLDGQLWRYECKACKNYFTVNPRPHRAMQVEPYNPFGWR
jgi:hypothetical protein